MRVMYSCPLDPAHHGGFGWHVIGVVKGLLLLGHSVTLIHRGHHLPELEEISQIAMCQNTKRLSSKLWSDVALAYEIARAWRKGSYDLVYHRFQKASFLPIVLARAMGIPNVLEVNSDLRSEADAWQRVWLKRKLVGLSEWVNYALANHIIVVAEGIKNSICEIYGIPPGKVSVVPNGADLDAFYPMDRVECCERLGLDSSKRYAVFAGTFQRWQGLETIVQAAPSVQKAHPEVVFLIVGDGPEGPKIEELVRSTGMCSSFRFAGWCSPKDTALYLGAGDVCLAPYTRDATTVSVPSQDTYGTLMKRSPLKIYTYLAAGRPIVASDFAEGGMLVQNIGAGIAVPPERPDLLAEAIGYVLNHPEEAGAMGKAGRKAAEDRHGWQAVAGQIADICRQVQRG